MPRQTHEQWELDATAGSTHIRPAKIVRSFSITESWNLKLDHDGAGQPDEDAWEEGVELDATTAKDIEQALKALYPQRKFEVELIETEEIDV